MTVGPINIIKGFAGYFIIFALIVYGPTVIEIAKDHISNEENTRD